MQDSKATYPPSLQGPKNSLDRAHLSLKQSPGRSFRLARLSRRRKRHLEELEKCNLEFLEYSMHKIRSPLASIIGYAELLTETEFKNDPEFIQHSCQVIIRQGQHIMQTTEDLVIAARINSIDQVFNPVVFSLAELLSDLVDEIRHQTQREIRYAHPDNEGLITGDALQLRTVFMHLLDNAEKYSPAGKPTEVILAKPESAKWVQVQIKDQGIGIGERENSILFQRFRRIHNELTTGIPGNGLGLYIVKNIVERHHGKIEVDSLPGEGTTFSVYLPSIETDRLTID